MYKVFLAGLLLPITPEKITIKGKNMNKQVVLINEGEVNILKVPGLETVTFDCCIPAQRYPFVQNMIGQEHFVDFLRSLKSGKQTFQFVVTRLDLGRITWDTNITCSLEEWEIAESWDEGRDLLVKIALRESRNGSANRVAFVRANNLVAMGRPRPRVRMGSACGGAPT